MELEEHTLERAALPGDEKIAAAARRVLDL